MKNEVKIIQAAAYNGARTVDAFVITCPTQTKNLERSLLKAYLILSSSTVLQKKTIFWEKLFVIGLLWLLVVHQGPSTSLT